MAAQLKGHEVDELESLEIQPIDMNLAMMKQAGAKWLVEMTLAKTDSGFPIVFISMVATHTQLNHQFSSMCH